jgi:O-succinylbenzoic acid--CoA ligase
METTPLILSGDTLPPNFWAMNGVVVMQNPRAPQPLPGVLLTDGLLFATSGSSGHPKWLRHTKETLLASAAAVNQRFRATAQDVWLRALPLFHVGGMGIEARAHLAGSEVIPTTGAWDPAVFCGQVKESSATLCSLVPTQVFDLVSQALQAPVSLRAVIVGGGQLRSELKAQARALGWPVLESYGLTEAGSQVATELEGKLTLLDCWEARVNQDGCLEIKGPALAQERWQDNQWQPLTHDDWFTTNDHVEIEGRNLHWLGRADAVVKILGELVNLDHVQQALSALTQQKVVVVAMADERNAHRLYASVPSSIVGTYNQCCPPFARLSGIFPSALIVRSALQKPLREPTKQAVIAWHTQTGK